MIMMKCNYLSKKMKEIEAVGRYGKTKGNTERKSGS
jgi:hypothetical protein